MIQRQHNPLNQAVLPPQYPEDGEEYEMTRLPQESQGPLTSGNIALREIEGHFPNMSHTELEFRYKEAPNQEEL